jgi:hypothetical protein
MFFTLKSDETIRTLYPAGGNMKRSLLFLILLALVGCASVYNDRGISSLEKQQADDNYYERTGMAGLN